MSVFGKIRGAAASTVRNVSNTVEPVVNNKRVRDVGNDFKVAVQNNTQTLAKPVKNTATMVWNNTLGTDFVKDNGSALRDEVRDTSVSVWNKLPGNELVESKVGDALDPLPMSNAFKASVRALSGQTEIELNGEAIDLIKNDPAIIGLESKLEKDVAQQTQNDPRYSNEAFELDLGSHNITLGGERGDDFSSTEYGEFLKTLDVAADDLTWLIRNTSIDVTAHVSASGDITLEYSFTDVLDLRPTRTGDSEDEKNYNRITTVMGAVWHDFLGAEEAEVRASWTSSI